MSEAARLVGRRVATCSPEVPSPVRPLHVTLVDRADWLAPMVTEFLDAPDPEAE